MTEETLFHRALALPAGERAAFLAAACAGDAALRRRLEVLLQAHADPGSFMAAPPVDAGRTLAPGSNAGGADAADPNPGRDDAPGGRVGPYKLLQLIGEGGMGAVWMAEQTAPVERKVALKVIKAGLDSERVVARFEAERQALALMDHPNIAKVLDAGTTPAGRPFFVMELVKGVPITAYCDGRHLTPKERLELFVPVCQAVQHAHQKGLIHPDLKPSNILIGLYDGRPVPKVIDFGVAKAAGPRLTERTLFTEFGAVVGTLEYMSPEQAELNNLDIDTRSDIYSLGVLLYELLTGTTPLQRKRLKEAALLEVLRLIREEEPPKPSTRLSTTAELPAIAANRGLEPKKLSGLVRGELDWIVMKALEKDRNRRYESANGLAADVERYLADEPVFACPPTARYRLRKFLRKHRTGALVAVAFVTLLVAGAAVSTWLAVRAQRAEAQAHENERQAREAAAAEAAQRRQAEAVAGVLESVFDGLDPKQAAQDLKGQLVGRLDAIADTLAADYAGEPVVRARLRNALGFTQEGLGEYAKAVALHERALAERRQYLGPDHPDTLRSMNGLAAAHRSAGNWDKALPLLEETLEGRRARLGPDHPDTLQSVNNLAAMYYSVGQVEKALPLFEQTLDAQKAKLGPNHTKTLVTMNNLAAAYRAAGQVQKALPLYEQALQRRRARLGPDHPETLKSMNNLATAYNATGQTDRALPLLEQALEKQRARLGPDHPEALTTMGNLALAYKTAARFDKALPLYEQALEKRRAKLGPDHPETLLNVRNLALAYQAAGQIAKALPLFEQTLEWRRAKLGPDHPDTQTAMNNLAQAYEDAGNLGRAEPLARDVLAWARAKGTPESVGEMLTTVGRITLKQARYAEAELLLREDLARRGTQQPGDWSMFNTQSLLGGALVGQKKYAEAEPLLVQGYEGLKQRSATIPGQFRTARLTEALERLVQLHDAWGRPDEAAEWRTKLNAQRDVQKK
jgi:serine/threonine protein kinase/tetratricopeptide (TPR) repeat protein